MTVDATVTVDGIETWYSDEGEGAPVLLLHGAPDSGALWRHQMPRLHAAGFRTIVPDLRGFGRSSRPPDVESYRLAAVLRDVLAVLRRARVRRLHVVGHDWGGQVAWLLGSLAPRWVDRLVVIASAHPAELWDPPIAQRQRAWYMYLAQHPHAEELVARDGFALVRAIARGEGDMDAYLRDLARPGAVTALLNWYRANAGAPFELGPPPPLPPVAARTLAISSPDDHLFVEEVVAASARHVAGRWAHVSIPGTGHWVPLDAPERVADLLCEFLGAGSPAEVA